MVGSCRLPGRPQPGPEVPRPEEVLAFAPLYRQNCAGCHGESGSNGSAIDLANPVYQELVSDDALRRIISRGEPGTLMPGFSKAKGGMLTDQQIEALVSGMRKAWKPRESSPQDSHMPAYATASTGDSAQGLKVYQSACASCHGTYGEKAGKAGNILDGTFLSLLSPESLRTIVIAGRPDLGHPDWSHDIPGHPLSESNVSDLVAWMMSLRSAAPGAPYPRDAPVPNGPTNPTSQH
jgi:cytochrome c oxidase cbb3-type subunit 3/ubiquinol-cytochrome c reductase cytochrome c subunit